jgi:hypothetical protein
MDKIKCKLHQCLNRNTKGFCDLIIPTIVPNLKAHSITCPFFDSDFEKTFKDFKQRGGVLGDLARGKGKKTPDELKEIKKIQRAEKSSKKRKKELNTLDDLL